MATRQEELSKLTKDELLKKADRLKAGARASMRKDKIILAIQKAEMAKAKSKPATARKKAVAKTAKPASTAKQKTAKPASSKKVAAKPAVAVKKRTSLNAKTATKASAPKKMSPKATASDTITVDKPTRKPVLRTKKRDWSFKNGEGKFFIAEETEDLASTTTDAPLPAEQGDNHIIALPRDPRTIYVYWATNSESKRVAAKSLDKTEDSLIWALRIFDVTGKESLTAGARLLFDLNASSGSGNKYISLEKAGGEYVICVGLKDENGNFAAVATSAKVMTPDERPSTAKADSAWQTPDEAFMRLYSISSGGVKGFSSLGGSELMFPGGAGASEAVSSFGASEEMTARDKERGFHFWLDCELIVYGGTAPDATVTMMGKELNLRPDGTFSARFSLPDGIIDIPVFATSGDRLETREISPTVTRRTYISSKLSLPDEEMAND